MKYIYLKILTILCLLCTICYSQSIISWQRLYDGGYNEDDYFIGICRTADGNFVLDGYTTVIPYPGAMILKINNYGDILCLKHYPGVGTGPVISKIDGGTIVASAAGFFKMDSSCDSIWFKRLPFIGVGGLNDFRMSIDGGYIACGYAYYDSGYVVKTDSLCNVVWQKIISDPISRVKFTSIVEAYSNGYLVGGYTVSFNEPMRTIIVRLDTEGNIVWQKIYQVNYIGGSILNIFKLSPNYLVAVSNGFLKIDDYGNLLSSTPMQHDSITSNRDIKMISDNAFVVIANSTNTMLTYSKLMYVDSSLNILNSKSVDFSEFVRLSKIQKTGSNDFLFTGEAELNNNTTSDFYVIRCDTNLTYPPIKIRTISTQVPENVKLYQNYPNPFNGSTIIGFDISVGGFYNLKIYDLRGKLVSYLLHNNIKPGRYNVIYNPINLSSGIYFYNLYSKYIFISKKMVYLK